jgi:hypothetical protein
MKRTWTIIGVRDVPFSFKWYQSLFGQAKTAPGHDNWGQICDSDGTVLLCLHHWGAHEHPSLMSPDKALPGNGLLLFRRILRHNQCALCGIARETTPQQPHATVDLAWPNLQVTGRTSAPSRPKRQSLGSLEAATCERLLGTLLTDNRSKGASGGW